MGRLPGYAHGRGYDKNGVHRFCAQNSSVRVSVEPEDMPVGGAEEGTCRGAEEGTCRGG